MSGKYTVEYVQNLRKDLGLSVNEFASALGYSVSSIKLFLYGFRPMNDNMAKRIEQLENRVYSQFGRYVKEESIRTESELRKVIFNPQQN